MWTRLNGPGEGTRTKVETSSFLVFYYTCRREVCWDPTSLCNWTGWIMIFHRGYISLIMMTIPPGIMYILFCCLCDKIIKEQFVFHKWGDDLIIGNLSQLSDPSSAAYGDVMTLGRWWLEKQTHSYRQLRTVFSARRLFGGRRWGCFSNRQWFVFLTQRPF